MATIALGVLGAGIGSMFGNPMMGFSLGMTLGGVLFPERMAAQERGKLDDLRITGSGYGAMIPQAWGRVRVGGNIIWSTDLVEHVSESSAGGKGGGPTVRTYSYTVSCAVAVCRGPINRIQRIWAEDQVIYDYAEATPTTATIRIYTGTEVQTADTLMVATLGAAACPAYRGLCYVVLEDFDLSPYGNRMPTFSFEVCDGEALVSDVLTDIADQVGLDTSEYDFSAACKGILGYVVSNRTAARDAVAPLLKAMQTDLSEYDGKIMASTRGCASVATVAEEDLGAHIAKTAGGDGVPEMEVKRGQDLEMPARVDVTYFSQAREFDQATQSAMRYARTNVQEALTLTLPMTMTDALARTVAERELYRHWLERHQYHFSLGPKWLKLVPGSPVTLPVNGTDTRVRIVSLDLGLFGEVRCLAVQDDDTLATQTVTAASSATTLPAPELSGVVATTLYAWSGPAIVDADADALGFYWAATGPVGWRGCTLYYSPDGVNGWQVWDSTQAAAVAGTTATTLATYAGGTCSWDTTNTVDVTLVRGTLETASTEEVLQGANCAILGDELIRFRTVTDLGGGSYRLSNLLRGQRGTVIGSVAGGSRFVLLQRSAVHRAAEVDAFLNRTFYLRAVSVGQAVADVANTTVVLDAAERKPYAPVTIAGSRDGSLNLTITWNRRVRKDGEWQDAIDVPLDEAAEEYEVDIMDGASVVRSITGLSSATATYSAADQIVDWGAEQASVAVNVYQIGTYGRGAAGEATV